MRKFIYDIRYAKIILAVLAIALIFMLAFAVDWGIYYSKFWKPMTEINKNTKCSGEVCTKCMYADTKSQIHLGNDTYIVKAPDIFRYSGFVKFCSDDFRFDDNEENKYALEITVDIGDSIKTQTWKICLEREISSSYYSQDYIATINPDTLLVISEDYRSDQDKNYVQNCETMIREGVSKLREMYSPYLGN